MSINKRIKELREEKKYSQLELSKLVDVVPVEISRIENFKKNTFSTELLSKLAAALGTSVPYLVEGKGARQVMSVEELKGIEVDALSKEEWQEKWIETQQRLEEVIAKLDSITKTYSSE